MRQKLLSWNIFWEFDILVKIMKKKGRSTVNILPSGDRWVADISLTLITSKPRSTNPSQMSSAGEVTGGGRITVFTSFWDLG
jgi:hypothetical protein